MCAYLCRQARQTTANIGSHGITDVAPGYESWEQFRPPTGGALKAGYGVTLRKLLRLTNRLSGVETMFE